MIAALFVQTEGCYLNLEGVDPWDEARDARKYRGPYPVIAKSLAEFADQYNLFEGKAPTEAEIAAARAELVAALQRVLGVGE